MLSVFCCIACAVLVILDVTGKLHPERTRSQVLLHLFSLVGALVPLVATLLVPWFVDDLETLPMPASCKAGCSIRAKGRQSTACGCRRIGCSITTT